MSKNKFKLIHTRDLSESAYAAEVFYEGIRIGEKSIFPEIDLMDLLFESLEAIDWNNPPIGLSNKIRSKKMTKYGFKTEIVINPTTKTISTFMPHDPNINRK